jgi:hypothetical protein
LDIQFVNTILQIRRGILLCLQVDNSTELTPFFGLSETDFSNLLTKKYIKIKREIQDIQIDLTPQQILQSKNCFLVELNYLVFRWVVMQFNEFLSGGICNTSSSCLNVIISQRQQTSFGNNLEDLLINYSFEKLCLRSLQSLKNEQQFMNFVSNIKGLSELENFYYKCSNVVYSYENSAGIIPTLNDLSNVPTSNEACLLNNFEKLMVSQSSIKSIHPFTICHSFGRVEYNTADFLSTNRYGNLDMLRKFIAVSRLAGLSEIFDAVHVKSSLQNFRMNGEKHQNDITSTSLLTEQFSDGFADIVSMVNDDSQFVYLIDCLKLINGPVPNFNPALYTLLIQLCEFQIDFEIFFTTYFSSIWRLTKPGVSMSNLEKISSFLEIFNTSVIKEFYLSRTTVFLSRKVKNYLDEVNKFIQQSAASTIARFMLHHRKLSVLNLSIFAISEMDSLEFLEVASPEAPNRKHDLPSPIQYHSNTPIYHLEYFLDWIIYAILLFLVASI